MRLFSCAAFLALGLGGATAGTGSCTAGPGGVVDGGSCCTALGGSGCNCDESGSSASGVVSCTASNIKDGSTAVVRAIVRPANGLKANTGDGDPPAMKKLKTE